MSTAEELASLFEATFQILSTALDAAETEARRLLSCSGNANFSSLIAHAGDFTTSVAPPSAMADDELRTAVATSWRALLQTLLFTSTTLRQTHLLTCYPAVQQGGLEESLLRLTQQTQFVTSTPPSPATATTGALPLVATTVEDAKSRATCLWQRASVLATVCAALQSTTDLSHSVSGQLLQCLRHPSPPPLPLPLSLPAASPMTFQTHSPPATSAASTTTAAEHSHNSCNEEAAVYSRGTSLGGVVPAAARLKLNSPEMVEFVRTLPAKTQGRVQEISRLGAVWDLLTTFAAVDHGITTFTVDAKNVAGSTTQPPRWRARLYGVYESGSGGDTHGALAAASSSSQPVLLAESPVFSRSAPAKRMVVYQGALLLVPNELAVYARLGKTDSAPPPMPSPETEQGLGVTGQRSGPPVAEAPTAKSVVPAPRPPQAQAMAKGSLQLLPLFTCVSGETPSSEAAAVGVVLESQHCVLLQLLTLLQKNVTDEEGGSIRVRVRMPPRPPTAPPSIPSSYRVAIVQENKVGELGNSGPMPPDTTFMQALYRALKDAAMRGGVTHEFFDLWRRGQQREGGKNCSTPLQLVQSIFDDFFGSVALEWEAGAPAPPSHADDDVLVGPTFSVVTAYSNLLWEATAVLRLHDRADAGGRDGASPHDIRTLPLASGRGSSKAMAIAMAAKVAGCENFLVCFNSMQSNPALPQSLRQLAQNVLAVNREGASLKAVNWFEQEDTFAAEEVTLLHKLQKQTSPDFVFRLFFSRIAPGEKVAECASAPLRSGGAHEDDGEWECAMIVGMRESGDDGHGATKDEPVVICQRGSDALGALYASADALLSAFTEPNTD